jgi:excinuclease ABC subunit A
MGPEGGEEGGRLRASGTPEEVAGVAESHTGRFLREIVGEAQRPPGRRRSGARSARVPAAA